MFKTYQDGFLYLHQTIYMKNILLTCLIGFSIIQSALSQEKIKGNKQVTTVETKVDPFHKLVVGDDFEVILKKSFDTSVEIEADENLHDIIHITVSEGALVIETTKRIVSSKRLNITVNYNSDLNYIIGKGDSEIAAISTMVTNNLKIEARDDAEISLNVETSYFQLNGHGKGDMKFNIKSDSTTLDLNENSKIEALINSQSLKLDLFDNAYATLEGNLQKLDLKCSGNSDLRGNNLTTNTAKVFIQDNGEISIHVNNSFELESIGNGDVDLYGAPQITIHKFDGTSQLKKKEL